MNSFFLQQGYSPQFAVLLTQRLTITISGTFVGTVTVERQQTAQPSDQTVVATFTAPGTYMTEDVGLFRLNCSAFTSGKIDYVIDVDSSMISSGGQSPDDSDLGNFASGATLETAYPAAAHEGQTAYLLDVKKIYYSNGTAWNAISTGGGGGGAVDSVNGFTGDVVLTKTNIGLANVDNTSDATKNAATATLSGKTLTAPVINSPTGIVKADVGLGNVDNTSDATKNTAVATLTNKTLTSPIINTPTGIVKGDVGLGNVDNTSNATERAATATLTNKTISGASNTLSNIDNSSLTNSGITVNGFAIPLGGIASLTQIGAAGGGANNFTGNQQIDSANPRYLLNETDAGTDLKLWDISVNAGVLTLRTRTDADGAGVNALAITRGATTAVAGLGIPAPLTITAAEPRLFFVESDAAANAGWWDIDVNANVMSFRTRSDVDGAGSTFMSFTRSASATTPTAITFAAAVATTFAGNVSMSGSLSVSSGFSASAATPSVALSASGAGTNLKRWNHGVTGTTYEFSTVTDAGGAGLNILSVVRGTTTNIASIAIGNATNNQTGSWLGTGTFTFGGQLTIALGKGLTVTEGSNAKMGVSTLVAGTVVVSTTAVTANSRIFLTAQSLGTVTVGQGLAVSARTAGTSFTIISTSAVDTSVVAWMIVEPS